MRALLTALIVAAGLGGNAAEAQDTPVVVELYTSQGCSSCPPADEMLLELAQRRDVIALALHVDYWDYIGWADSFADPAYTRRQQNYARVAGHTTIYTPQMVIGGQDHVVGTKPMDVADAISAHRAADTGVELSLSRSGGQVLIEAVAERGLPRGAVVQLVRYNPREVVDIRRGENAGRQLTYGNIVTSWQAVGDWDGRSPLRMRVNAGGNAPVVVILQEPGPGRIMAAAELR